MWKIPLFDLDYGKNEQEALLQVLKSKWLSSGEKTKQFESEFARYIGDDSLATAVSSATAALHISLMIAGVSKDDEVIVPGLTFVADANVVIACGGKPVFADTNSLEDWNQNIEDIKSKVTERTKAVIVVHFAGYPMEDIHELVQFCKKKNIILIEDVAHAVGASCDFKKCGTFGDMACFSFFSNKNLSTGEGGMFLTKNSKYSEQAKLFRSHGMTSMTLDRHEGRVISYDVVQMGLNYRIDEMRSALGLIQLEKLDSNNLKRKALVNYYIEKIQKNIPQVSIPFVNMDKKNTSSYHIFVILLPEGADRISVIEGLKKAGIQTSIHYPSFKYFSYYNKFFDKDLKNVSTISKRVLTLPLYPNMSFDMINEVVDKLAKELPVG